MIGFTVAVMVPVGALKVIACVKGVVTELLWSLSQMQKTNDPGVRQVSALEKLNAPLTLAP